MKTKTTYCSILSSLILFCVTAYSQNNSELPSQATNDWYKAATENLIQKEYQFEKTTNPTVYKTVNSKNHLGF